MYPCGKQKYHVLKFRELNIHEENEHEIPKVLDLPLLPIGASPKDLAIRRAQKEGTP